MCPLYASASSEIIGGHLPASSFKGAALLQWRLKFIPREKMIRNGESDASSGYGCECTVRVHIGSPAWVHIARSAASSSPSYCDAERAAEAEAQREAERQGTQAVSCTARFALHQLRMLFHANNDTSKGRYFEGPTSCRGLHCGGFSVRCYFISLNLTLLHC